MNDTPVQFFLSGVENVKPSGKGYSFRCPAHDDRTSSASIYADADGNAVLKCYAGCTRKQICAARGITESDLYVTDRAAFQPRDNSVEKTYVFEDEKGTLLYKHLRVRKSNGKKTFFYCRPSGQGGDVWTLAAGWFEKQGRNWKRVPGANDPDVKPAAGALWLDDCRRVLYRLPALLHAAPGSLVLFCEGEKDVESAEALGFLATTAGGASDWRKEFAERLAGFDLVILPDNDGAGRNLAAKVARDSYGKAARVRVLELAELPEHGDFSDWLAAGGDREALLALIDATPDYAPPAITQGFPCPAVWHHQDFDQPVLVTGEAGTDPSGRKFFSIEGSATAIPADELELLDEETDITNLEEIDDDDRAISDNPRRESYLRSLAVGTSKVNRAMALLIGYFGFQGNHWRLINALIAIGGARLGWFVASQTMLMDAYHRAGGADSRSTIKRDFNEMREEENALGIYPFSYKPGGYDSKGKAYASMFRNNLLRWALEAISLAIDIYGDESKFKYDLKSLKTACQKVASKVRPVDKKDKDPAPAKPETLAQLEAKFAAQENKLIEFLTSRGWSIAEINSEFDRLQRDRQRRIMQALKNTGVKEKNTAKPFARRWRRGGVQNEPPVKPAEQPGAGAQNGHSGASSGAEISGQKEEWRF